MTKISTVLFIFFVLTIETIICQNRFLNKKNLNARNKLNINYSYHNSLVSNTSIIVRGIEDNSEILHEFPLETLYCKVGLNCNIITS